MSRPRAQWTPLSVIAVAALVLLSGAACDRAPEPVQSAAPAPGANAASTPKEVPPTPAKDPSQDPSPVMPGLPPLPTEYAMARPPEVVQAAFAFAAQHPEVLRHVPCFCGCERRGHKNNDDCFVSARDAQGRVTEWEPHGMG